MKAVVLIDMPETCGDCLLCVAEPGFFGDIVKSECLIKQKDNLIYLSGTKIPEWCPLKPLPMKRETEVHWKSIGGDVITHEISDYDKGWNDCLEEFTDCD